MRHHRLDHMNEQQGYKWVNVCDWQNSNTFKDPSQFSQSQKSNQMCELINSILLNNATRLTIPFLFKVSDYKESTCGFLWATQTKFFREVIYQHMELN